MLLIYNVILDNKKRKKYDLVFSEIFRNLNIEFKIRYLNDELSDSELLQFRHILITGSELLASQESEENKKIMKVIRHFVEKGKAILGICYGHQMLAKAISGNRVCRKRKAPEFGWKKVEIISNPLFKGIKNPVFYESHYDEVYDLDENYHVIATNLDCSVQAFQYKNLPIWGVQFHPEVDYKTGEISLQQRFKEFPEQKKYYQNEMNETQNYEQRLKVFENFAALSSRWEIEIVE